MKFLSIQVEEAQRKIEDLDKEQEALVAIFAEERIRRDAAEDSLRNRLKVTKILFSSSRLSSFCSVFHSDSCCQFLV